MTGIQSLLSSNSHSAIQPRSRHVIDSPDMVTVITSTTSALSFVPCPCHCPQSRCVLLPSITTPPQCQLLPSTVRMLPIAKTTTRRRVYSVPPSPFPRRATVGSEAQSNHDPVYHREISSHSFGTTLVAGSVPVSLELFATPNIYPLYLARYGTNYW